MECLTEYLDSRSKRKDVFKEAAVPVVSLLA